MPRDRKGVESGLKSKGFRQTEGDHHYLTYYTLAGLKTRVFTKTSHSMKEIPDNLLAQMAKQCRLPRGHFLNLVDCSLARTAYEAILQAAKLI
jgi:hypothetical protein